MFGVTSIVVFDRAAAMIIPVGDAAIGAAVTLDADLTSMKITSVRFVDARLMVADARLMVADARVVNATDAGVMVTTDARVVNTTDARVSTDARVMADARVSPLF
jgi:hypothetical protein